MKQNRYWMRRWTCAAAAALTFGATHLEAQELRVVRTANRGWLGITFDVQRTIQGRETTHHVVITEVADSSPAARAGVLTGDTLLSVNGLAATQQLIATVPGSIRPGDRVTLRLQRNGERDAVLEAGEWPAGTPGIAYLGRTNQYWPFEDGVLGDSVHARLRILADSMHVQMDTLRLRMHALGAARTFFDLQRDSITHWLRPDSVALRFIQPHLEFARVELDSVLPRLAVFSAGFSAVAGARLEPLTPELGSYFGTSRGVLVLGTADGTPAARAGLQAGDVIVRVNGQDVESVRDVRLHIAPRRDAPTRVEILRRQQPLTLEWPSER